MGRQGSTDREQADRGSKRQSGKTSDPDGHDGWSVEPALPPRRERGPVETEWRQAVRDALADGLPRSRVLADDRTAHLVVRRLRHAATTLGARLHARLHPDTDGVKIIFTATRKDA